MNRLLNRRWAALAIGAAAVVAMAWIGPLMAQEKGSAKGGATKLLKPIKTAQDIAALKPGDAVVMACPKCKDIAITYIEKSSKASEPKEKTTMQHLCPGCGTRIEATGHGKAKKDEVIHVCQKCGSHDVMCCVLKKGSAPTKGMKAEE